MHNTAAYAQRKVRKEAGSEPVAKSLKFRRLSAFGCACGQARSEESISSVTVNEPIGAIARLQLGPAYALAGDSAKARAAYQHFLALWQHADPDIPHLQTREGGVCEPAVVHGDGIEAMGTRKSACAHSERRAR
ncbi:MAG TPA: hypothetical protein VKS20_09415 [Candidatus Acidoferrales bacterium]|nr:hypothetical protein [Candidatus Acidoferrales bacterium]